jgi:hypothetical protein
MPGSPDSGKATVRRAFLGGRGNDWLALFGDRIRRAAREAGEISEAALSGVWCADVKVSRAWMGGLFEASGELREWVVVGAVILHVGSSLMASESYLAGKPRRQGGTRKLGRRGGLPSEAPPSKLAPLIACLTRHLQLNAFQALG